MEPGRAARCLVHIVYPDALSGLSAQRFREAAAKDLASMREDFTARLPALNPQGRPLAGRLLNMIRRNVHSPWTLVYQMFPKQPILEPRPMLIVAEKTLGISPLVFRL
jgi:hypothetical protein